MRGNRSRSPCGAWLEIDTGPALEDRFGPDWEDARRFMAPGSRQGETLGSTVPEYYHQGLNVAVEVKRFNLLEAGIDPTYPEGVGTPSPETVEALNRARRQAEGRRWAIRPPGGPPGIWMVFDIRGMGVTDVAAVG